MTESPLSTLRRIAQRRPVQPVEERCDMCATPVDPAHQHVVDLQTRQLMCACRACYLLFTDTDAHLRYRSVPDRYARLPAIPLGDIPVEVAFLFRNSAQDRMVACYPGPAGATESDLDVEEIPELRPDVEAVLVRGAEAYLVPIDVCYELVGRLRTLWRGFDGGQEVHAAVDEFFTRLRERTS